LVDAHLPEDPRKAKQRQKRNRELNKLGARLRAEKVRRERRHALSDPRADLKPAAVSVRDFKILSGLSHATIYRHFANGTLKSIRFGGRRLIAYSEVERIRGE
jgi:hypothetical protein